VGVSDVFVSHASEDKARFVDSLVAALRDRGLQVWYDKEQIRVGDDFRRKMDEGLSKARFGVVVLSPNFFKYWPEAELSALFNQERVFDETRILPIRLDLDRATLTARSPLLAGRADLGWELGVSVLAERIHDRVRDVPAIPRSARSPVYNAPARRAQKLFGRDVDLERLDQLLVPGRNVRVAASIEGLAGVGKTELALHIVDRLSETGRFTGGIFWLDAENPDLTVAWGTTIADALAVGPGTVEERAASAVRIASSGAPVLVVLDNVERWTRESEPKPLPHGSQTALLVTTRHKFFAGPTFTHHTLETLPPDAAREFLVSVAGRELTADELLRHLDGHTLAIELAGAYLREFPAMTPSAYLKLLTEGAPVEEKVQDLVRYEATVRRALDVHWEHLEDTAREALLVAACFAPEDATIALLEACGAEADADAQQPLRRFHLITGDGERWRMHRLVREWARRTASPEDLAKAKHRFVEGCVEYSKQINLQEGFRICRADGPHLEQAVREAEVVFGSDDRRVSVLFDRLGTGLQSMGDLPRAKDLFERALTLDLKNFGEDHPSVAARRSNLAIVLRNLSDLTRARDLLECALASDLKNLGEDHPSVAIRRSNLAGVLNDLGDLTPAKDLLERALTSDLKNLGEDHPTVAINRSKLAVVLSHMGDPLRAKDLLDRALASDLKNLGEDHPSVAVRRFNLATVSLDLGDLARARGLFAQTLSALERSLGAEHPTTSYTRVSLASVMDQMGETELAHAEAERALRAVASQPEGSLLRVRVEQIAKRVLRRS
jgi:tetratricopeptide (TPR) repeat protein